MIGSSSSVGGTSGSITPTQPRQSATYAQVEAGETVTMRVANQELMVTQLQVSFRNRVNNMRIIIERLEEKPTNILSPQGETYRYMEITKTGATNDDISEAKIRFKVEKSWYENNGLDPSNTKIHRWTD